MAWLAGVCLVGSVAAGEVFDGQERDAAGEVTHMFLIILHAAAPFHLMMETAERMNARDTARSRKLAKRLIVRQAANTFRGTRTKPK